MVTKNESDDLRKLNKEGAHEAPNIAINYCVGLGGKFAKEHVLFVIMKKATTGNELWEKEIVAEFASLEEALTFPEAKSYGSSTLCTACRKLPKPWL